MRTDKRHIRIKIIGLIKQYTSVGGTYNKAIALALGVTKQVVNYHIKWAEAQGYVIGMEQAAARMYCITQKGQDWLAKDADDIVFGKNKPITGVLRDLPHFDNVHNVHFKCGIRQHGLIWLPGRAEINGWTKRWGWIKDVQVEQTTKSIIFRYQVEAKSEWEATAKVYRVLFDMINLIETHNGYELGHPEQMRTPHYTMVGDPVAEELRKRNLVVYVRDEKGIPVGHFDGSHDRGEAELYTPETAAQYLNGVLKTAQRTEAILEELQHQGGKGDAVIAMLERVTDVQGKVVRALEGIASMLGQAQAGHVAPKAEDKEQPPKPGMYG